MIARSFVLALLLGMMQPALYGAEPLELTLEDAVDLCLKRSWDIESARQRVLEAEGGVISARSGFLPRITAEGSYTRLSEVPALDMAAPQYGLVQYPVFGPLGDTIGYTYVYGIVGEEEMSFGMGEEDNYVGRIGLTQPLFTWGRTVNGYRLANHNVAAARYDYVRAKQDAVFNVTRYFYSVLVAREFLSLTEESYAQVERHALQAARLYEEGKISKLDLMRANVARDNMRPQMSKARNAIELASDGLKMVIGLKVSDEINVSGVLEYEETSFDPAQKLEEARRTRPDLASIEERREMAERSLAMAQAGNKPTVVAAANYEYKKPYNFQDDWGSDWNATLAVSIPLFSGFAVMGDSKRARAQLEQASAALEAVRSAVELEVKAACLALEETDEAIQSQKKNVEQAEEAYRIAERQFENGVLSNIEYLDTQIALSQAKANYVKALGDFNIAKAQLDRAAGSGNWKGELGR